MAPGAFLSLEQQALAPFWARWARLPGAAQQPGSARGKALDDSRTGVRGDGRVWGTVGGASGWREAGEAGRLGWLSEPVPGMGGSGAPTVRLLQVPRGQRRPGPADSRSWRGKASVAGVATRNGSTAQHAGNFHKCACFQSKLRGLRTSDQTGGGWWECMTQSRSFTPRCLPSETQICVYSFSVAGALVGMPHAWLPASTCLEVPRSQPPPPQPPGAQPPSGAGPRAHLGRRCSGVGLR